MPHFGPHYCETPGVDGFDGFPIELINTLTNAPTILLGVIALGWAFRDGSRQWERYALAFLLSATGIGSTLWHGLREPWALTLDVLPGVLFLLLFVYAWVRTLSNPWWALAAMLGLFGLQSAIFQIFPFGGGFSPLFALFGVLLISGSVLWYYTWRSDRESGILALSVLGVALLAAAARTADDWSCAYLPWGSHFLWHVLLGLAAFLGIALIARLAKGATPPSGSSSNAVR